MWRTVSTTTLKSSTQDDLRDLVEYIMGNKPNGVTEESANVNGDKKVNIADVVALTTLLK